MDNKEINNSEKKSSSHLQDYEIEVPNKKNFFTKFLEKFKFNKNQKLLNSGNRTKTTNKSISSLWGFGNLKAALFHSLDSVQKMISEKFSAEPQKNTFAPEIIGNNLQNQKENQTSKDSIILEVHNPPIIPVTEQEKNAIKKSNKPITIEIATIDTSAIRSKTVNTQKKEKNEIVTYINSENKDELNKSENDYNER